MASDDKNDGKSDYREWFDDPYAFDIPDATYDDLPKLVRSLKRAAIDAYVRDKKDSLTANYSRTEDEYTISVGTANGGSVTTRITRPDENGEGGGKVTTTTFTAFGYSKDTSEDMTEEFEGVRHKINSIIKPWVDLPDPKRIGEEVGECQRVISLLADKATIQSGKVVPSGTIQTKVNSIHEELVQMGGYTMEAFKSNIIENVGGIVSNLYAATTLWSATLNAEQGTFTKARESVVQTVKNSIKMFNDIANDDHGKLEFILEVAKFAVEAFKTFSGVEALGKVADTASSGLRIMEKIKDDKSPSAKAASYEDGIAALLGAFRDINRSITKVENAIKANIIDNMDAMSKARDSYDLKVKATKSSDIKNSDKTHIEQSRIDNILGDCRHTIIEQLDLAWTAIENIDMADCVIRNEHVGIGVRGPSPKFHDFKWLLHDLIKRLSNDTQNAFKNFELAIECIKEQDQLSKRNLDSMRGSIEGESGPDPWQDRD